VHSFLLDAEIAARLAGILNPRIAVIGSERNTDYTRKWRQTVALRLTGRCFDAIIANSHAGKRFQMRTLGIEKSRIFVIHNGVDVRRFRPISRAALSRPPGLPADARVVGMFCSFKAQKNHAMFFRMAQRVRAALPGVKFLCVGDELHRGLDNSSRYHRQMLALIQSMGLSDDVICLGNQSDVAELYNVCDVTVLTSRREGTPNVVLESMACEVPVVVTDVADNALIVPDGRVGFVVPYDDDCAMADRVGGLLSDETARRSLGAAARRWVAQEFSTFVLARKSLGAYRAVRRQSLEIVDDLCGKAV
jgi:glycosyltransferase involved in cell wall biosynthesis